MAGMRRRAASQGPICRLVGELATQWRCLYARPVAREGSRVRVQNGRWGRIPVKRCSPFCGGRDGVNLLPVFFDLSGSTVSKPSCCIHIHRYIVQYACYCTFHIFHIYAF